MLTTGRLRAVILNSGGANACTGPGGFQDTHATAEAVAAALSDWGTETGAIEVAVCSTGLIGDRLPMDKVLAGVTEIVHEMAGGLTGGDEAAHAIMTTDTVPKQVALHHRDNWTVGGMAKGAGMLAPSLATMLVRASPPTPSPTPPPWTPRCAGPPRPRSTGSTSTAAARPTTPCCCCPRAPARSRRARTNSTTRCCARLRRPVRTTAGRRRRCHQAGRRHRRPAPAPRTTPWSRARAIARDSLVKTALFGSDPNWGRVLAAVGIAPVDAGPEPDLGVVQRFSGLRRRCRRARARGTSTCRAPTSWSPSTSGSARHRRRIRTTDLSHAYVEENSAYSS